MVIGQILYLSKYSIILHIVDESRDPLRRSVILFLNVEDALLPNTPNLPRVIDTCK